ncbi:hypothetical protein CEXT_294491 [Caerostris extrusa]|uniref:Uncharacterized protein n=1 Tax=Caerostris extrusa TaxID=172846 RepID=A0AAV4QHF1_CAEEX|nr:hypothetical protein CEXT_294491 [Caerostris extrusa]
MGVVWEKNASFSFCTCPTANERNEFTNAVGTGNRLQSKSEMSTVKYRELSRLFWVSFPSRFCNGKPGSQRIARGGKEGRRMISFTREAIQETELRNGSRKTKLYEIAIAFEKMGQQIPTLSGNANHQTKEDDTFKK